MDERVIKRLVVTLIVAIAIILLAKSMLRKTYTNLNKATEIRKQAVIVQPPVVIHTLDTPTVELAPASGVETATASAPSAPAQSY
jgi:collagenase-like PrtC family protease